MRIRTRLVAAFLVLSATSIYLLVDWVIDDLKPRYMAATEEAMVDMANLLASIVEARAAEEGVAPGDLRAGFEIAGSGRPRPGSMNTQKPISASGSTLPTGRAS